MIRVKKCETTGFEPGKSCPGFLYVTLHCWPWTVWFSCVIVQPLLCQFCLPRPSQAGLQWWVGCRGFEFSQDILGYDAYASKRSHACAGVVFWIAVVAEVCQSNYLHGFEKKGIRVCISQNGLTTIFDTIPSHFNEAHNHCNQDTALADLPLQFCPFPLKPSKHVHVKLPWLLTQYASLWHGVANLHSLISWQIRRELAFTMPPARHSIVPSPTSRKPDLQLYLMTSPNWNWVPKGVLIPLGGVWGFLHLSTGWKKCV